MTVICEITVRLELSWFWDDRKLGKRGGGGWSMTNIVLVTVVRSKTLFLKLELN